MQTNQRRRTLPWIGALLLVAGLLLLMLPGQDSGARGTAARSQDMPEAPEDAPQQSAARLQAASGAVQAALSAPAETPVIHSITVEKPSVCQMEENLITVHASTPSGRDGAHLRYLIHGHEGRSVPLKVDLFQAQLPLEVIVYGRDGTVASAPIPRFEVRDCWVEDELAIFRNQVPGKQDTFRFEAKIFYRSPPVPVQTGQADPAPRLESTRRPVRYRWTFGDGTTVDTTEPWVERDLGARRQDALYSQLLLTCDAMEADGRTLVARHALQIRNPDFELLAREAVVRLHAQHDAGAAVVSAEGMVKQAVRLWHRHSEPVTIRSIKIRRLKRTDIDLAMESDALQKAPAEDADVHAILGGDAVVPPSGLAVTLAFASNGDERVVAQEYLLEGTSADGLVVRGSFTVMRPDLPPMTQRMLADAAFQARVLRARAFLGKTDVTDNEVHDLMRHEDGVYADLADDESLPPAGTAAAMERGAAGLPL